VLFTDEEATDLLELLLVLVADVDDIEEFELPSGLLVEEIEKALLELLLVEEELPLPPHPINMIDRRAGIKRILFVMVNPKNMNIRFGWFSILSALHLARQYSNLKYIFVINLKN
jgi:hypothetical protein